MIEETPLCDRCRRPFKPAEEDPIRCKSCFGARVEPIWPSEDGEPSEIALPEEPNDDNIGLRNTRIDILEHAKRPRFSRGLQAGVGYCVSAAGQQPCIYGGYGFSVRLP